MKFHVLTLFPEIPQAFFSSSIMARAVEKGLVEYSLVNIRDFAFDRHKTCDDSPYGGGAGMLMLPEPLGTALDSVGTEDKRVIYLSPSGRPFSQGLAQELSRENDLVFICGRYEGIDQ
ncbi:MAG: tRNA (guanosine(37)-N1)-methyltransferase TrmD, partial [Spirochaetaceae bacterium]|nr:tRNA (guanosine(37)-N1)-methyltransferase TrmD [Spirochaetaceae bacterium]